MTVKAAAALDAHRAISCLALDLEKADIDGIERLLRDIARLPVKAPISLLVKTSLWRMTEQHSGPTAVAARLREAIRMLSVPRGQLLHHPHVAKPIALESDVGNHISSAYKAIDAAGFTLSGKTIRALHELGLWRRSIVLVPGSDGKELTYRYIGSAHRRRFGRWTADAIGQPCSYGDPANPAYSQWVSRYYQLAFHNGTPVRHIVDSLINQRQPTALPDRTNYDRLLAPMRLVDGRAGLLVVSEVTPGLLPLAPCNGQDPAEAPRGSSKRGPG